MSDFLTDEEMAKLEQGQGDDPDFIPDDVMEALESGNRKGMEHAENYDPPAKSILERLQGLKSKPAPGGEGVEDYGKEAGEATSRYGNMDPTSVPSSTAGMRKGFTWGANQLTESGQEAEKLYGDRPDYMAGELIGGVASGSALRKLGSGLAPKVADYLRNAKGIKGGAARTAADAAEGAIAGGVYTGASAGDPLSGAEFGGAVGGGLGAGAQILSKMLRGKGNQLKDYAETKAGEFGYDTKGQAQLQRQKGRRQGDVDKEQKKIGRFLLDEGAVSFLGNAAKTETKLQGLMDGFWNGMNQHLGELDRLIQKPISGNQIAKRYRNIAKNISAEEDAPIRNRLERLARQYERRKFISMTDAQQIRNSLPYKESLKMTTDAKTRNAMKRAWGEEMNETFEEFLRDTSQDEAQYFRQVARQNIDQMGSELTSALDEIEGMLPADYHTDKGVLDRAQLYIAENKKPLHKELSRLNKQRNKLEGELDGIESEISGIVDTMEDLGIPYVDFMDMTDMDNPFDVAKSWIENADEILKDYRSGRPMLEDDGIILQVMTGLGNESRPAQMMALVSMRKELSDKIDGVMGKFISGRPEGGAPVYNQIEKTRGQRDRLDRKIADLQSEIFHLDDLDDMISQVDKTPGMIQEAEDLRDRFQVLAEEGVPTDISSEKWLRAKEGYGKAASAMDGAAGKAAAEERNQSMSLTDKMLAYGGAIGAGGPMAMATGDPVKALGAAAVGGALGMGARQARSRGPQSMAVTADMASKALLKYPALFGDFATPLRMVYKQSPQVFAGYHQRLMENNPDYQKVIQQILQQEATDGSRED